MTLFYFFAPVVFRHYLMKRPLISSDLYIFKEFEAYLFFKQRQSISIDAFQSRICGRVKGFGSRGGGGGGPNFQLENLALIAKTCSGAQPKTLEMILRKTAFLTMKPDLHFLVLPLSECLHQPALTTSRCLQLQLSGGLSGELLKSSPLDCTP